MDQPVEILNSSKQRWISALILSFLSFIFYLLPSVLYWDFDTVVKALNQFVFSLIITFPALIGGILVHEGLHALSFIIFGQVKPGSISFGLSTAGIYTHCSEPVTTKAYRIGLLLPLALTGILPVILSFPVNQPYLVWFGMLMSIVCADDLLSWYKLKGVLSSAIIQDHPEKAGCIIVSSDHK